MFLVFFIGTVVILILGGVLLLKSEIFKIILYAWLLIWFVIAFIGIMEKNEAEMKLTEYVTKTERISISALNDESSYSGSYNGFLFVQSGSYKGELKYQVMLVKGNKKRFYNNLNANTTDIIEFEQGADEPHLEVVWEITKYAGKEIPSDYPDEDFYGFSDTSGEIRRISIYIPKGTVNSNFELDLK